LSGVRQPLGVSSTPSSPGRRPVRSRAAIEQSYRGFFESPLRLTTFALDHSESRVAGDVTFDVGAYRQVLTCPDGPREDTGQYVVILKRSGGGWKMAYLIYNSDRAPASSR
jgi:ketosteroid isomerase-like protein